MTSGDQGGREQVQRLVEKCLALDKRGLRAYNEANTKDGFVRPLFEALGWDFVNLDEVEAEKSITPGRVDYLMKVNGVAQFTLEVKALHVDVNEERWARQAISYAYFKGVTWAVLTNFRLLRVFNAGRETKDVRQVAFLTIPCEDYVGYFERLSLLSRDAVARGDLDREAIAYGRLPQRLPVERRLYQQLVEWRERLFNDVYPYYKSQGFTWSRVDELVQHLLNRLIFIRAAEDRGLVDRKLVAALHYWEAEGGKAKLMDALRAVFREFAHLYDSELFPQLMDPWDSVTVYNSRVLADMIRGLYEVPGGLADWDFATVGSDVLGTVYEQYLGYVPSLVKREATQAQQRLFPAEPHIGLTAKMEKRKGGGIYYTPRWVVDYIVRETVGRFVNERNHNDILSMTVLDPACGSGSFLTRAYEELLAYHAPQQGKNAAQLLQAERTRILLANIFGVDLDEQAVQFARLSLLLSSLSGQEALPALGNNICRGNSLVSGTDDELRAYFGDAWEEKHRFNWEEEFPHVAASGGFDVVLGNPPYVRIQSLPRQDADYYRRRYRSAVGSFDIYVLFLERALELLKPGGRLGFIASGKFLKAQYGKEVRRLLHERCTVESVVDLSAQKVFAEATTYPAIVVLRKAESAEPLTYAFVPEGAAPSSATRSLEVAALDLIQAPQEAILEAVWPPRSGMSDTLIGKFGGKCVPLRDVADKVFVGLQTSADKVYILDKGGEPERGVTRVYSRALGQEWQLESALLKPLLTGKNTGRYYSPEPQEVLLFPYRVARGRATLIGEDEFSRHYPAAWEYLNANRGVLEEREGGKFRGDRWYAFGRTQNLALHEQRKLAAPSTVKRLTVCYDPGGNFYLDNVRVNGILLKESSDPNYRYLAGLMNSRLLHWTFRRVATPFANGWYGANRQFIEPLPIRVVDFDSQTDRAMHDDLVAHVGRMLELQRRLAAISEAAGSERDGLLHEIELTDRYIDGLVYDLYGLTEGERRVVETEIGEAPG